MNVEESSPNPGKTRKYKSRWTSEIKPEIIELNFELIKNEKYQKEVSINGYEDDYQSYISFNKQNFGNLF